MFNFIFLYIGLLIATSNGISIWAVLGIMMISATQIETQGGQG